MSRRADVAYATRLAVICDFEPTSGTDPASTWQGADGYGPGPCHPHQSELVLGAYPSAVQSARLHVRLVLREWGLEDMVDAVDLVVSELATNAVLASEGLLERGYNLPFIQLWLTACGHRVLVQVWDANPRMPQRLTPGPEAEHGWGLAIVAAVSESCGEHRLEGWNGKVVWALLRGAGTGHG